MTTRNLIIAAIVAVVLYLLWKKYGNQAVAVNSSGKVVNASTETMFAPPSDWGANRTRSDIDHFYGLRAFSKPTTPEQVTSIANQPAVSPFAPSELTAFVPTQAEPIRAYSGQATASAPYGKLL
jgi:hypothetical protein